MCLPGTGVPLAVGSVGSRFALVAVVSRCVASMSVRMVLSEGVLGIRRREYELERQAAAHDLESSRGQLAYLSTLVREG